jgi:hypothetical protein
MLALACVRKKDLIIDLGCGDARIVIEAAKRYGARGIGVKYQSQTPAHFESQLKLGAGIVSHSFDMGTWKPTKKMRMLGSTPSFLWKVREDFGPSDRLAVRNSITISMRTNRHSRIGEIDTLRLRNTVSAKWETFTFLAPRKTSSERRVNCSQSRFSSASYPSTAAVTIGWWNPLWLGKHQRTSVTPRESRLLVISSRETAR